ncbi:hypothetical protein HGG72_25230 [Ochrobactrum pecoris]|nr:hypothetical protein [Brucella pecoris]
MIHLLGHNSLAGRFLHHKTALAGLTICVTVFLAVVIGPLILPYGPEDMDFMATLAPPSLLHPFGTDSFGRDVLVRVLAGGQVSLMISFVAILLATVIGGGIGPDRRLSWRLDRRHIDARCRSSVRFSKLYSRPVADDPVRFFDLQHHSCDFARLPADLRPNCTQLYTAGTR